LLSKEGFKHHLNNIEHYTVMAEVYKKRHPDLAKRCLESVEMSKKILLDHYELTERLPLNPERE
jgi:hypothetical protein